jgi:hypothetical protein
MHLSPVRVIVNEINEENTATIEKNIVDKLIR